jgi:GNAT superfamily N-acetyltransferase
MTGDLAESRLDAGNYLADKVLRNGTRLRIRAIRPDDKARLLEHFNGLGVRTRYFRFFEYKCGLDGDDLVRFTQLDFDRHVGPAATLVENGRERFIGVGRYVRRDDRSRAEIALTVLDEYQGEGIGSLLIQHLAQLARQNNITRFEADVMGDNSRMLEVLRKSGCILSHASGAGIVHFTLRCPEFSASSGSGGGSDYVDRQIDSQKGDDNG